MGEVDAARQAAQLMAQLCSSAGTVRIKQELGVLLRRERITLAQFSAALSALSDERGAAAYAWGQEQNRSDEMRGDGPDATARDIEGEVDRALRRPEQHQGPEQGAVQHPRTVRPDEIRAALEQAIADGRGIVVLEVRRPGQPAVRARLAQIVWAALWDVLALDPEDEDDAESVR